MYRRFILVPLVAVAAFGLIACGDDDDDNGDIIDSSPTIGGGDASPTIGTGDSDTPDIGGDETPTIGGAETTTPDDAESPGAGGSPTTGTGTGTATTVSLEGVGASTVSGQAMLTPSTDGESTDVSVTLDDTTTTGSVAIYEGDCETLTDLSELESVADVGSLEEGSLDESVDMSLDELSDGSHVLVVESEEGDTAEACGVISGTGS